MEKTVTKREVLEGLITLAETGECTLAAEDIKTFAEYDLRFLYESHIFYIHVFKHRYTPPISYV